MIFGGYKKRKKERRGRANLYFILIDKHKININYLGKTLFKIILMMHNDFVTGYRSNINLRLTIKIVIKNVLYRHI